MSTEAPPEVEESITETPEELPAAEPVEAAEVEAPVAEEEPAAGDDDAPADESSTEAPPAEAAEPLAKKPDPGVWVQATGKRKSAIARVVLQAGDGTITFTDGRTLEDYFGRQTLVAEIIRPLEIVGAMGHYKITARIDGGGLGGQAGALRHAIARALIKVDENLRTPLKREGFLTRDARVKERKKAGLKGARKRPQFSKR